jgi:hypothetical protein
MTPGSRIAFAMIEAELAARIGAIFLHPEARRTQQERPRYRGLSPVLPGVKISGVHGRDPESVRRDRRERISVQPPFDHCGR